MRKTLAITALFVLAALGPITLPIPANAASLSISASGNQLLDAGGAPIQLRGVNRSGTEYACIQGWGIFDGPSDAASVQAIAAWHVNIVRVLLNEDCWLGINGVDPAYAGATYQAAIVNYVNLLHANGMYAEVSLIWAAPGTYQATYQPGAPDADHSPAMWSSMAAAFKGDPGVILAPWGETIVDANCFLNGGVCEATYGPSNTPYNTAGMQQAVTVMRGAGYNGPIAIPCLDYANDCTAWLTHKPSDPANQLVAEAHVYGKNTCADVTCFNQQMLPVAQSVPMIWGEAGETYDASDCGSSIVATNIPWAMTYTSGVEAWTWDTWGNCDALISTYAGAPYSSYGQWVQNEYAQLAAGGSCVSPSTASTGAGSGSTTFYFAEGFTGPGFTECLAIFMPNASGQATIDYWTQTAHTTGVVNVSAGKVATVNVNRAIGPNQQVSVKVTLPAPGIVERLLHFNFGNWHGSTDIVGVAAPNTEWDFAEGSTLSVFSEYLTLQNPNSVPVPATLTYMTDTGAHPVKTVPLPANSRTTVEVFNGSPTATVANCVPSGSGASCGVGPGIGGVSVRVTTPAGEPIVAERPFYVNGFGFGFAAIHDGHVAFGANAPATHWYFAEGTTITSGAQGFKEYLTMQNPSQTAAANVTLRYVDQAGRVTVRNPVVNPLSRLTVEVFNPLYGVGPGVGGVSTEITSDQPIVAERPMYMSWDFGSGLVNGATDVLGATSTHTLFGFAALSTDPGQNDYLTLQNPGASAASVTIDYYTATGKLTRPVTVNAHTRVTIQVFDTTNGVGPGQDMVGAVVTSTNAVPILVEKPTYSAIPAWYGATDTMADTPATF